MQITEVALGAVLGGGLSASARAAGTIVRPHAGTIATTAGLVGTAAGLGYGAFKLGDASPAGDVERERAEIDPSVGPNGWLIAGDIATGVAALGTSAYLADARSTLGTGSKVGLGLVAAGLGAACIGSTIGFFHGTHVANQQVADWRADHHDEIKVAPKPAPAPTDTKDAEPKSGDASKAAATSTATTSPTVQLGTRIHSELELSGDDSMSWANAIDSDWGEQAGDVVTLATSIHAELGLGGSDSLSWARSTASDFDLDGAVDVEAIAHDIHIKLGLSGSDSLSWSKALVSDWEVDGAKGIVAGAEQLQDQLDMNGSDALAQARAAQE